MYGSRTSHIRFGVLCVLAYVAASWLVRFDLPRGNRIASLVYPFDTFSMYARVPTDRIGHLLLRDDAGAVYRITSFTSFDCEWPDVAADCVDYSIAYHEDDLLDHIDSHAGSGRSPLVLIRRTWQIQAGRAPRFLDDCELALCRVSPEVPR